MLPSKKGGPHGTRTVGRDQHGEDRCGESPAGDDAQQDHPDAGIGSRDIKLAKKWAKKLGIPRAYGSYEELLADPEIEAIYNPLPNHLHVPLTLQAVKAGKHVLCEKPIAITAKEAEQLRAVPKDWLVAEAFMVRHHPQFKEAKKRIKAGQIGELRAIQCFFSYHLTDPTNVRNMPMPEIGGGGLLDIGCYPIVVSRFLFESEPERVISLIERDPKFKTDRLTSAIVDFGGGKRLDFTISTQLVPHQRIDIVGTKGRIEVVIPFNAPPRKATKLWLDKGATLGGTTAKPITIKPCDQYQLQGEAFSRAVRGLEPLAYGIEDSIKQMKVLDALFKSGETGRWENV